MNKYCWMSRQPTHSSSHVKVVLPVCDNDKQLLLDNLRWQYELDGLKNFEAMLAVDESVHESWVSSLEKEASRTFIEIDVLIIPSPPQQKWPEAPNRMFQSVALEMQRQGRFWFWMEPDCVPLCPEWLDVLDLEYRTCGKPMMGSIVEGMGHCNGTAIYPSNFPKLSRRAMTCTDLAWDGQMKRDTITKTHNASHIMCHVWGIKDGMAQPFGGDEARFDSWNDVQRWVDLRAVVFHRCKNGTLITQLRKKKNETQ